MQIFKNIFCRTPLTDVSGCCWGVRFLLIELHMAILLNSYFHFQETTGISTNVIFVLSKSSSFIWKSLSVMTFFQIIFCICWWTNSVNGLRITAWKVSKYWVFSGPYFLAYGVSLRIQSECGKIRTRKNSVFGHFSRSVCMKQKTHKEN